MLNSYPTIFYASFQINSQLHVCNKNNAIRKEEALTDLAILIIIVSWRSARRGNGEISIIRTITKCYTLTGLTALYRYWKSSISDHFYTTNIKEIGTSARGLVGHHGYTSEGTQCLVYTRQVAGSVPLYRYWKSDIGDHFYTTSSNEIGTTTPGVTGNHGYISEGVAGYCFPHATAGTIPLYRYWKASVGDHFYTTYSGEIGTTVPGQVGQHGYVSEGVACYVMAYRE